MLSLLDPNDVPKLGIIGSGMSALLGIWGTIELARFAIASLLSATMDEGE